jgi:hypothetical protein
MMRWTGHVARMKEGRSVYKVSVRRPEGKRPLGIPTRKWEDNIKMEFRDIGINGANWIRLAQESPIASFCEHGNEPSCSIRKAGCCLTS